MEIKDNIGMPAVVDFIQKQLREYDLSKLDWFKLLPLKKNVPYRGCCIHPKRNGKFKRSFVHQYRIRVSVNILDEMYPFGDKIKIGTEQDEDEWWYIHETEFFKNKEEIAIHVAGHEVFHFLRRSKQIPGRNGNPQANLFGMKWLEEWRKLRRK